MAIFEVFYFLGGLRHSTVCQIGWEESRRGRFFKLFRVVLDDCWFWSSDGRSREEVNARPSDKAMEALRFDFVRDGVMADAGTVEALYNEACQGYRPAVGSGRGTQKRV